jgi:hypothetical protein
VECGIFAHGFARARCDDCGHEFLVAFSCKGLGVCPSCTLWRVAKTAAYLTDHVFPRLPVRQWVLAVPKQLRYFMQRDGPVLRFFLRLIEQTLQASTVSFRRCILRAQAEATSASNPPCGVLAS